MINAIKVPIPIQLVFLGKFRPGINTRDFKVWSSKLFRIVPSGQPDIDTLEDPDDPDRGYEDTQLSRILNKPDSGIVFGILDAPLVDGFYIRRLEDNRIVISLYEIAAILDARHYSVRNFIYRNVYQIVIGYLANGGIIPSSKAKKLAHNQIAGCIFDWNANKGDVVHSLDSPRLCEYCKGRFAVAEKAQSRIFDILDEELRKIAKPRHLRILSWVVGFIQRRPWVALTVSVLTAIALNVLASILYDHLKEAGYLSLLGVYSR